MTLLEALVITHDRAVAGIYEGKPDDVPAEEVQAFSMVHNLCIQLALDTAAICAPLTGDQPQ